MGSLLNFVVESVRRSVGASIATAILLLLGVNVQSYATEFFQEPPEWLLAWWAPWLFVVIALLLLAHIFQKQVTWLNNSGPRADISILWLFDHLNNKSKWSVGKTNDGGNIIFRVEGEIRDAARSGRISIWGRQAKPAYFTGLEISTTQTEIEPEYWMYAEIDLTTVCSGDDVPIKTHVNQEGKAKTLEGLKVNKAQCLKEWGKASCLRRLIDRTYRDRKTEFRGWKHDTR